MKARIPKRAYTTPFREAAVRQVIEVGGSASEVARSLDISSKTLGNEECHRHGLELLIETREDGDAGPAAFCRSRAAGASMA